MGAGKSTVGRIIAKRLHWSFEDVDTLIEESARMTVNEIFEREGEPFFRDRETRALMRFEPRSEVVISTGGGIVLRDENWRIMRKLGPVVSLTASPRTVYERVRSMGHRPLLKVPNPFDQIVSLMKQRNPFYLKADLVLETDGKAPETVASAVIDGLGLREPGS